jgi:group I intron endonuclease
MINVQVDKDFKALFPFVEKDLPFVPVKVYNNMLTQKDMIFNDFKRQSGIYLLHNLVNGKQYVGSAKDLKKRLYSYYSPLKLMDNRYVSRSILKYGHDNFYVIIVEIITKDEHLKKSLLGREQYYLDILKPQLNLSPTAGSNLGYKYSEETRRMWSQLRMGKKLSEETKAILSKLFSGELNPFYGKTHNLNSLMKIKLSKMGELNPMYGRDKSPEFVEQMYKDKKGSNNPMFGKTHLPEALSKMRKPIWVYNSSSLELIKLYDGTVELKKDMKMSYDTIKKYLNTNQSFKGKYFRSIPLDNNDS